MGAVRRIPRPRQPRPVENAAMDADPATEVVTVTTTVASRADGETLARAILDARLAACVQLEEGLTSFYRWEGRMCTDPEVRLTIKTLPACLPGLQQLFAQKHPYEVPQFVVVGGQASAAYAAWVRGEVTPAAPGRTPGR
jgi:periplasmic divalent cation tolerance protein